MLREIDQAKEVLGEMEDTSNIGQEIKEFLGWHS
jgi:hypothetical protein